MQTSAWPARVLNQYLFNEKKKKKWYGEDLPGTDLEKTVHSPNKFFLVFSDGAGAMLDTEYIWWGRKQKRKYNR